MGYAGRFDLLDKNRAVFLAKSRTEYPEDYQDAASTNRKPP
jgi:hypothetical protein